MTQAPVFDARKLVAALRDTAAKGVEKVRTERKNPNRYIGGYDQPETITDEYDRYSREWIVGRIEGLADAIETISGGGSEIPTKRTEAA
jgi:hypothetical protein